MEIICKRRIQFLKYEFYNERFTGDTLAKVIDRFTVNPSIRPQQIPLWVNDTSELDEYIACGAIVVIGERPAPSVQSTPEPQQAAQPTAEQTEEQKQAEQAALMEILNTPIALLTGGFPAPGNYPTRPDGFPRQSDAR
ncbi:MAG: hypothetical protein ABSE82_14600 [Nitrososphaerales archaeon]|jgi:hypothetical protein